MTSKETGKSKKFFSVISCSNNRFTFALAVLQPWPCFLGCLPGVSSAFNEVVVVVSQFHETYMHISSFFKYRLACVCFFMRLWACRCMCISVPFYKHFFLVRSSGVFNHIIIIFVYEFNSDWTNGFNYAHKIWLIM